MSPTRPSLPVAPTWFRRHRETADLERIEEPHVHELLRANIWWLRGRDRDLVVDTGLGVASLREEIPGLADADPLVVLTHAHLDHMGGAHEFAQVHAHPGDPFTEPPPGSLFLGPLLAELAIDADTYSLTGDALLDAAPHAGYVAADYRLRPPRHIAWVADGTRLDLGDRAFTVLHLPGHTAASIALFDDHDGTLFSGDVVYDDVLIDDCVGADPAAYRRSLLRLLDLDVRRVHPGHGDTFGAANLRRIARAHLDRL